MREHRALRRAADAEEVVLDDAVLRPAPRTRARRLDALRHVVEGGAEQVARPGVVQHGLRLGQRLVVGDRDLDVADRVSCASSLLGLRRSIAGSSVFRSGRTPVRIASRCIGMLSASRLSSSMPTWPRYACECQKMSHGTSMRGDVLLDLVVAPADAVASRRRTAPCSGCRGRRTDPAARARCSSRGSGR